MKVKKTINHGKESWVLDLRKYRLGRKFFPTEAEANEWWADFEKKTFREGPTLAKMNPAERADMLAFWWRIKAAGLNPSDLFAAAALRSVQSPLLVDAFEICVKAKEAAGKSKDYARSLRFTFRHFGNAHKNLRVCEIETIHIERWLAGKTRSPRSTKNDINNLSIFFGMAIRRRWRETNPCDALERITVVPPEPGILRVKAAAKLMRVCYNRDREMCSWFAVALFCGVRTIERKRLKADAILTDRDMIKIGRDVAKNYVHRLVDIRENAKAWIEVAGGWPTKNIKRRFNRIRKQAGLLKNWPHNALRHSAASYMLALNNNAAETSLQMGHSVSILMKNYRTPISKEEAEEFFTISPPPLVRILQKAG